MKIVKVTDIINKLMDEEKELFTKNIDETKVYKQKLKLRIKYLLIDTVIVSWPIVTYVSFKKAKKIKNNKTMINVLKK